MVSEGLPRKAQHHWKCWGDVSQCRHPTNLNRRCTRNTSSFIDSIGWGWATHTVATCRFLRGRTSASLEALALALGTDPAFVKRQVESRLSALRLIDIGSRGRKLTDKGLRYINRKSKFTEQEIANDASESGQAADRNGPTVP